MKVSSCVLDWRGGTRDWSRYHHSITNHNAIPVRGVNGDGMELNGTTAYLDCGNSSALNINNAITIEIGMKPASLSQTAWLVSKITYGGTDGFLLDLVAGKQRAIFGANHVTVDAALPTVNINYTLAATYDQNGGANNLILYKNGVFVKSDTKTGAIPTNSINSYIGIASDLSSSPFNGTISLVRIYNRALTPLEIWNNYQVMKPYIPLSESPVAIV